MFLVGCAWLCLVCCLLFVVYACCVLFVVCCWLCVVWRFFVCWWLFDVWMWFPPALCNHVLFDGLYCVSFDFLLIVFDALSRDAFRVFVVVCGVLYCCHCVCGKAC